MEINNQDLRTIGEINRSIQLERLSAGKVALQTPGQSHAGIKRASKRVLYSDVQLHEALQLAIRVGVAKAAEVMGVNKWSIYKYAQRQDVSLEGTPESIQARMRRRRPKYPESTLREAFAKAVQFHLNSGATPKHRVQISKCIMRAAEMKNINGKYLLNLYSNRNPILGFSPDKPDEVIPSNLLT